MGQPDAGFLDRVHPNAGLPVISRFFHDEVPYEDCSRNAVVRFLNSESVCRQICTTKVSYIFQWIRFFVAHSYRCWGPTLGDLGWEAIHAQRIWGVLQFQRERGVLHSAETYGASISRQWIALQSHGIHGICSQRKWIRHCTGQGNIGNTEILIILGMWWWGTWEFNFDK